MKKNKRVLLQILLMLFLLDTNVAYAAQQDISLGSVVLKMIIYIAVIAFVLILTIYGTRFIAKNSQKFINSKYIKIVDILNLNANVKLLLIDVNENIYLLAISSNSIEFINKFEKNEIRLGENFDEHLSRFNRNYNANQKNFSKMSIDIQKLFNAVNRLKDKEEEEHEKDH